MKIRDVMTNQVIRIDPDESVAVAARALTHYNIGALPVCSSDGKICGLVTDRDIVTRCLASGRAPEGTVVRNVMTWNVVSVSPDTDAAEAARLMGQKQIRRLPVVDGGKLCGMVSLGDLASAPGERSEAAGALTRISSNVSRR